MNQFAQFYEDTYIQFKRFLVLKAPRLDRVDDILQDSYVNVYLQMKKKDIRDPKAYLFQVGWNNLKKEYRLKCDYSLEEELCYSEHNVEDEMIRKVTLEELWELLKEKSLRVQKCVYLYYLGMSLQEIAQVLNVNVSTIKNDLYRTLRYLKEKMK